MYGTESEKSNTSDKAIVTFNNEKVTLPESVPYDEPPEWTTTVTLNTRHSDSTKNNLVHKNILSLFEGRQLHTNLVKLWKELKKQYNAILQKLLILEEGYQIVIGMEMYSQRGFESYKREIDSGRFSSILVSLFVEMSEGVIDLSVSLEVVDDKEERLSNLTLTPSTSIGAISTDMESALGGFSGDAYGTFQEEFYDSFSENQWEVSTGPRSETGGNGRQVEPGWQSKDNLTETHSLQHLSDVRHRPQREQIEIIQRLEQLEITQTSAIEKGFLATHENLHKISQNIDNLQSSVGVRRDEHETDPMKALTSEFKDLRTEFEQFKRDTSKKLEEVVCFVQESMSDIRNQLMIIQRQTASSSRTDSLQHLSLGPQHTQTLDSGLPAELTVISTSNQVTELEGGERPISPTLEAAFRYAEEEGLMPKEDEANAGLSGDQKIVTELVDGLGVDQAIVKEANEIINSSGLPFTADVLKVVIQALQVCKNANGFQEISEDGIDTVLCLDLSSSMDGKNFEQMKSVLIDFFGDADELSLSRNLSENIGVVVFGSQTEVLFPLGTSYSEMLEKICNLTIGGTSPLHTALTLCGIVLKDKGCPMLLGGYLVPPRIVLFSDGRPTDDSEINNVRAENATKPPEIGERVKAMAHQLHHHGYTVFTVSIGNFNKVLLQDLAESGGGKMFTLENIRYIKKYFNYQVIAGTIIQKCHETGQKELYKEYIKREVEQKGSGLDEDDIVHIIDIVETSKELEDDEHDSLPLGSRVKILSEMASSEPLQYGTVVQSLSDGVIKVQLDGGDIHFYHYGNGDRDDICPVQTARQLERDQLIVIGVCVNKKGHPSKKGVVFRVTNTGYVDVRWDNGHKERCRFGAEGEFDVEISKESSCAEAGSWQWMHSETQQWIPFDSMTNRKLEQAFQSKSKTCIVSVEEASARVSFERNHMKFIGKDITLPVRRLVYDC